MSLAESINPTDKKPLIRVRTHRDHLLGILEQLSAHADDESLFIADALRVVLDATSGGKL